MNLIMLSGNSLRNRDWINEAKNKLQAGFETTYVQQYAHWQSGAEWIDLPHEQAALKPVVANLEPYGVFAKSIGTALIVQSITAGFLKPQFLLLLGAPLGSIEKSYQDFAKELFAFNGPVFIMQNNNDPVGSFAQLQTYLGTELPSNIQLIETTGDTHDYVDFPRLEAALRELRDAADALTK